MRKCFKSKTLKTTGHCKKCVVVVIRTAKEERTNMPGTFEMVETISETMRKMTYWGDWKNVKGDI